MDEIKEVVAEVVSTEPEIVEAPLVEAPVETVEEVVPENVSNPCEVCGGKGRVSEKESCSKCEGTGVIK